MPLRALALLAAVLTAAVLASPAAAAPGDLDTAFSGDGKATATFGSSAFGADVVRLPSGAVVVAGDAGSSIALAAFDAAGDPAAGFGEGGKTTTTLMGAFPRVTAATVDLAGRILVVGEYLPTDGGATSELLLARYDASGILDPTFDGDPSADDGGDGVLHTPIVGGGTASANDVLVEPDGDIVVGGISREPGGHSERATMVRYNGDGTLDGGFGDDGIARFEDGGMVTRLQQIVREPSGRIVGVGSDISGGNVRSILVQRVRLDGTLDPFFGSGGRALVQGGDTGGHAILRQSTGKLVVGADAGGSVFRFVRLTAGGDVDDFGGTGNTMVDVEMGGTLAAPFDLLALDDKIIAAGRGYVDGIATMALLRLSSAGVLDTSFGTNGSVFTTFFPGQFSVAQAVIEDPEGDGRILAAGLTADGSTNRFAIARYVTRIPKPTAVTGPAQDVGETAATLTGTVDPNGSPTTYRFQYGTTAAYGSTTPARETEGGAVSEVLDSLASSTTYHFRIVATNEGGTVTGADQTFTTDEPPPGSPPGASTGDAAAVTPTAATLVGTVNPAGFATTYRFEYGTTTAYGSETPDRDAGAGSTGVERTEPVAGLEPRTTYHYRVVAANANGTTEGVDRTFTTPARPPVATTGEVREISGATAVAAARIDPQGTSTSFRIQYGTTTEYGEETPAQDAGAGDEVVAVSARLEHLEPFREYHYRVVAVNEGGEVFGADRTFRSDTAPPVLQAADIVAVGTDRALLRARVTPNGVDSTLCLYVGRTPDEAYARCDPAVAAGGGEDQTLDVLRTGLSPSTTYYWEAVVRSAKGQSAIRSGSLRTTDLPIPPPPPVAKPIVNAGCVLDFVHPTERGGAIHDVHAIATINPNGRPTRYGLTWKQFAGGAVSRQGGSATKTLEPTAAGDYAVHLPVTGWEPLFGAVGFEVTATNDQGTTTAGDRFNPPNLLNYRLPINGCAPAGERAAVTTAEIGGTSDVGFTTDLRGVLNASGQPTLWKFEYCQKTYCDQDGYSGFTQTGFAADRTNRPVGSTVRTWPGTTYLVRLLALNRAGVTRGDWKQWRTPPCTVNKCVGATGVELGVPYDNSKVSVTVTVDPGTVRKSTASASAKRKRLVVGRTTLRKVKAGPKRVVVRLKPSARRKLARRGRKAVRTTVTTVITPPKGVGKRVTQKQTATIALRPAKRKKG